MAYLLDMNVLIARTDPRHESHAAVRSWMATVGNEQLLFCPLVENGFLSIYGHPAYPQGPGSPGRADVYLLGLAVSKGARLATLDGRIPASAVHGGHDALTVIPQQ